MIQKLREAYEYRDFFRRLVYLQLHQRYQGSFLGFLWTLVLPLLTFASFGVIFTVLNRQDVRSYGIYFFSGYMFWLLFSNTSLQAAESIVGNPAYITRVYVPKILLPLASVAVNSVDLGAAALILLAIMAILGAPMTWAMLFLPVAIAIALVFVSGAALLCALANVFFRDFRHILNSVLFLWFFFSPILWRADTAPERARTLLNLNPVMPFLAMFQAPISRGELPAFEIITRGVVIAAAAAAAGCLGFFRAERRFYYFL